MIFPERFALWNLVIMRLWCFFSCEEILNKLHLRLRIYWHVSPPSTPLQIWDASPASHVICIWPLYAPTHYMHKLPSTPTPYFHTLYAQTVHAQTVATSNSVSQTSRLVERERERERERLWLTNTWFTETGGNSWLTSLSFCDHLDPYTSRCIPISLSATCLLCKTEKSSGKE